jgi:DNA-binding MarR family transcriptional regulator
MKDGEATGTDGIVGWPKTHFVGHKRRYTEFDAASVRAVLALRATAQRVENALGGWFVDDGLTLQKFGVLIVLGAEDEPITLSDLRKILGTTQANVTGLVAGLERSSLIDRKPSRDDRRVSYVSLSRTGKRLVESRLPEFFGRLRDGMRGLTATEKKTFVDLLAKIVRGYEELRS